MSAGLHQVWRPRLLVGAAVLVGLAALSACTTTPRLEPELRTAEAIEGQPVLVAQGRREATAAEYKALIGGMSTDVKQQVMVDKLLRASVSMTDTRLVTGNDARLLLDGPATFRAMFKDIDAAKQSIHLETFILEDDKIGQQLAERLIAAVHRGVKVRMMLDAVGSLALPDAFIDHLRTAGVTVRKFHPIDPTEDPRLWRSNNRNHRKILVIDGHIAFTGGINFMGVYNQSSLSAPAGAGEVDEAWRDTHVRLVGPVVNQFQHAFVVLWNKDASDEQRIDMRTCCPRLDDKGKMLAAAVSSDGGDAQASDIYSSLIAAIGHAQRKVWITQAYFAPDQAFIAAIKGAAERGVDVRLMLPGVSDSPLVIQASRSSYDELLAAGVKIYERTASTLHAKTMVVDGIWSTVGSANFDYRSFVHNYELNAVIVDPDFAGAMEKLYQVDMQQAKTITLDAWRHRPITQKAKEVMGDLLRRWL